MRKTSRLPGLGIFLAFFMLFAPPVRAQAANITIGGADAGAVNPFIWGVNAPDQWTGWVNNASFVSAINNAGIKLVRVNPIPKCVQDGQDPYPSSNTWNWTDLDNILNTIFNAGAQPLFVVCGFPAGVPHTLDAKHHITYADWNAYASFMRGVVNRYNVQKALGSGRTITYWEMWNEPTIEPNGIMGDPPTLNYLTFTQTVGNAMKAVDSTIHLLGPVDSWANMASNGYLAYAAQNLSSQIDILSWHNYGPSTSDQDRMNWTPQAYQNDPLNVAAGGGGTFLGPGGKSYGAALTEYNLCSSSFGNDAEFDNEYGSTYTGSAIINAMLGNVSIFCYYASAESGTNLLGLLSGTDYSVKAKAYYVFQLFGTQFAKGDRKLTASGAVAPIETAASFSSVTGNRYIALVNKDLANSAAVTITVNGIAASGTVTTWLVDSSSNASASSTTYSNNSFTVTIGPRTFAVFEVAPTFSTSFESGDTQPTWLDTIDHSSNISGYTSGINPECSPRNVVGDGWGLTAHTGSMAEMYSGTDDSASVSYCYYKVFSVSIPILASTKMSYWICPQQDNGRYVGIDYHCTDGSTLRDSGAADTNGYSMHPNAGHGGNIPLNTWTQIKCNVGQWLAGKTIDTIYIAYDRPASTGQYRGYIDDILITNGTLP